MNVRELIKELGEYPGDTEVLAVSGADQPKHDTEGFPILDWNTVESVQDAGRSKDNAVNLVGLNIIRYDIES